MEAGEARAEQRAVRWDTPSLAESGKRSRRRELEPSVEEESAQESAQQRSSGRAIQAEGRASIKVRHAGGHCVSEEQESRGSVCISHLY